MNNTDVIYKGLHEDERETIEARPRSERLIRIANLKNRSTREFVAEIAAVVGLPVLETIELVENPIMKIPLRLIHEYQCLPVKKITPENFEGDESDENNNLLPLVTVWLPDERMDRWIFAVSGRWPEWYLGNPEQVINTITQHFGVGASSLDESDIATNEDEEEARNSD